MGVEPEIGGKPPKMDGLSWKTLSKIHGLGGTLIFGNTHIGDEKVTA